MIEIEATILGSGSSGGVPRLGGPDGAGAWGDCDPKNPKNRRRRCSLLVRRAATTVLIDTSPDLREQLLDSRVRHIDGVLMTHPHADQTNGIDDLRVLCQVMGRRIDLHADKATLAHLMRQFGYCFATPEGSMDPQEQIDRMIEIVPADTGTFRNVVPKVIEDMLKRHQVEAWSASI